MLTSENYYQNNDYFSYSQYRKFSKCQAAAMAEIRGDYKPETSDDMLVGQYIDAYISGELEQFISEHPYIISSRGPTQGELKQQFKHANTMIERFTRDKLFAEYLQGDKQVILTGTIAGIPVKGKLDIMHPDRIVDFKSVKDFEPIWYEGYKTNFVEAWNYDLQGGIYQELVRQNTGKLLPYYIAAVTKEKVPDIALIHLSDNLLEARLDLVSYHLPEYQAIKIGLSEPVRCEKCDWCKQSKTLHGPVNLDDWGATE